MTERPLNVRFAVPSDEDEIMRLMEAAFEEQPIYPLNRQKMREKIRECTAEKLKDRKGFVAVLGDAGKLEGYLIGVVAQYWYTDQYHLEEISNFVHPDHRRGKHHPRDLMDFAKWFTEQLELPLLMGIFSTQRLEAKIGLYKRHAKLAGAVFVHNTGHIDGLLSEMG